MPILVCPNCGAALAADDSGHALRCPNGHSFDRAREGYVNLLVGSKSGERRGDSRASARARRAFLSGGCYACLKEAVTPLLRGTVLDICCGEGYYDELPETARHAAPGGTTAPDRLEQPGGTPAPDRPAELYGFDISKEMVRLAAGRYRGDAKHHYFVANLASIPVADRSIDTAIHLFAPFNETEFARVLKDDGVLYSVIPGADHLYEMKQIVYDTPYYNDEQAPEVTDRLKLVNRRKVSSVVHMPGGELKTLFSMTPYYYRTSETDRQKLDAVEELDLTVSFVLLEYRKTGTR